MADLLGCPFCGSERAFPIPANRESTERLYPIVRCMGCYTDVPGKTDDFSLDCTSAIEAWNSRAPSQDAETIKALRRPGTMVLLDGRNEHGSHVIPMLPTNLPPEFEEEVGEVAEEIIKAAEALGFEVGDVVWTEWFWNEPQVGEFDRVELAGYWEFVCVNADVTRALAGSAS